MEAAAMDRNDDVGTDENTLIISVSDDALERAAGRLDGQAWTLNFCTYNCWKSGASALVPPPLARI
jgi:hypothetical protein